MIVYIRRLKQKCLDLGLKVFLVKFYVDDTIVGLRNPGNGWKLEDGQLVWLEEKCQSDNMKEYDVVAAELVTDIAKVWWVMRISG